MHRMAFEDMIPRDFHRLGLGMIISLVAEELDRPAANSADFLDGFMTGSECYPLYNMGKRMEGIDGVEPLLARVKRRGSNTGSSLRFRMQQYDEGRQRSFHLGRKASFLTRLVSNGMHQCLCQNKLCLSGITLRTERDLHDEIASTGTHCLSYCLLTFVEHVSLDAGQGSSHSADGVFESWACGLRPLNADFRSSTKTREPAPLVVACRIGKQQTGSSHQQARALSHWLHVMESEGCATGVVTRSRAERGETFAILEATAQRCGPRRVGTGTGGRGRDSQLVRRLRTRKRTTPPSEIPSLSRTMSASCPALQSLAMTRE